MRKGTLFLTLLLLFLSKVAHAQPSCEIDDPFERNSCLLQRYVSDFANWDEDVDRRVRILLDSPYAEVNRILPTTCGNSRATLLTCALQRNYRAIDALLDGGADVNVRDGRGRHPGDYLYGYYLDTSDNPRNPYSEFIRIEGEFLGRGFDPNEVSLGRPMHFSYLAICGRSDALFDERFVHYRQMVDRGIYDQRAMTSRNKSLEEYLVEYASRRQNRFDLSACRERLALK